MSRFSSALRVTDLDDFIAPSQECIKPVASGRAPGASLSAGAPTLKVAAGGAVFEVGADGEESRLQRAKITLADCLACSGCVTSAETVLIASQSVDELRRVLTANADVGRASPAYRLVVVTLSSQSRAALAAFSGASLANADGILNQLLRQVGVDLVLDIAVAREIALQETYREFAERWRATGGHPGPVLASACPGWVCYAEKRHGPAILPFLSSAKSPQQVMGRLVKDYLARRLGLSAGSVYHVAIMPCYDKKLEASRPDFADPGTGVRDVDCVLTTGEVASMLRDEGRLLFAEDEKQGSWMPAGEMALGAPAHTLLDAPDDLQADLELLSAVARSPGSTSGGYLDFVVRSAARDFFDIHLSDGDLPLKDVRGGDFREVSVQDASGNVVFRAALANGFRNIQNIVRRHLQGKCEYDFIEIMACPGGCTNGGGQPIGSRVTDRVASKARLDRINSAYAEAPERAPSRDARIDALVGRWLGKVESGKARDALRTQFHAVEANIPALLTKW